MGGILFFLSLVAAGLFAYDRNKKINENIERIDNDPNSKIHSDDWYRKNGLL
jgi:hypothetical protein